MKINVAVFFGGRSVEHEVSVISGLQAYAALDREKYFPVPVYQAKDGAFYVGKALSDIKNYRDIKTLLKSASRVDIIAENGSFYLRKRGALRKNLYRIDVAFPVFHGTNGEDGAFQGLMEQLGLPYVGCGVTASAAGMDKYLMKAAFAYAGVPCLPCVKLTRADYYKDVENTVASAEKNIGYPMIVKPFNLGSSVGIGKATDKDTLKAALENVYQYTSAALCERCIEDLREINCSVLGDEENALPSVCEEPRGAKDFLSYADKYQGGSKGKTGGAKASGGMSSLSRVIPAPISQELTEKAQKTAVAAFRALGCEGVSRVDLMIDGKTGELFVNEINTIPGSLSFYLWKECGVPFGDLCDRLISLAFKRAARKAEFLSSFDTNLLKTADLGGSKGAK